MSNGQTSTRKAKQSKARSNYATDQNYKQDRDGTQPSTWHRLHPADLVTTCYNPVFCTISNASIINVKSSCLLTEFSMTREWEGILDLLPEKEKETSLEYYIRYFLGICQMAVLTPLVAWFTTARWRSWHWAKTPVSPDMRWRIRSWLSTSSCAGTFRILQDGSMQRALAPVYPPGVQLLQSNCSFLHTLSLSLSLSLYLLSFYVLTTLLLEINKLCTACVSP